MNLDAIRGINPLRKSRIALRDFTNQSITSERIEQIEFTVDEVCHLLQNDRRQWLVAFAADMPDDAVVTTRELADRYCEDVGDGPHSQLRKRVYVAFYQQHLDTVVEAGVFTKHDTHTYSRGPNAIAVGHALEAVQEVVA